MQLFVLLIVAAQLASTDAPPVEARAVLERAELPFHRVTHYRVYVVGPADAELALAPWPEDLLPGLEVSRAEPAVETLSDGRTQFTQEIKLAPTVPRTYTLPKIDVLLDGAVAATLPAEDLVIRELTPEEREDVAAPQELVTLAELRGSTGTSLWVPLVALLIALLLVLPLVFFFRRGLPQFKTSRALAPDEVAYARLDELARELAADSLSCESLFVALSAVLRDYIGARYAVTIHERSTPEFVEEGLAMLPIAPEQAAEVQEKLVGFDRVKFAQYLPDADAQHEAINSVRDLIARLEARDGAAELAETRGAA